MFRGARFVIAWAFPLPVLAALALGRSAALALFSLIAIQLFLALVELLPFGHVSFKPSEASVLHRVVLRVHVPLQFALLAAGVWVSALPDSTALSVAAAGLAVGGITGAQGITFAHELGHSRSALDRKLAWLLMSSVMYAHFMVEHYRGHHVKAATMEDPASARLGESLWRFLPRTLSGSFSSAWRLERARIVAHQIGWAQSPLLWVSVGQIASVAVLGLAFGGKAVAFWLVQTAYAVFLLEAINYVEHYGLVRQPGERFLAHHAWNADHALTNSLIANLQRHSDHHMKAWKPYPALEALHGPQLPTGYVGCQFLACFPPLWFKVMHPRLQSNSTLRTTGSGASDSLPVS